MRNVSLSGGWCVRLMFVVALLGGVVVGGPSLADDPVADEAAIASYGSDYPHYVEARRAQLKGEYGKAVKLYEQVESPMLAAVAAVEIAACWTAIGEVNGAAEKYGSILQDTSEVFAALNGDVLLRLARLRCQQGDYGSARDLLDQALRWHRNTSTANVTPPPDVGNICPDLVSERTVLHPATTAWLLPNLHSQTLMLRLFVTSQLKDSDGSKQTLADLHALAQDAPPGFVPEAARLQYLQACVPAGAFVVPEHVWGQLTDAHGPILRLSLFYCAVGETAAAANLLSNLVQEAGRSPVDALSWATVQFVLGLCTIEANDEERAVKHLKDFTALFRQTELAPVGQLYLGNVLAGQLGGYKDAIRTYGDLAKNPGSGEWSHRAMLGAAIAAVDRADAASSSDAALRLRSGGAADQFAKAAEQLKRANGSAVLTSDPAGSTVHWTMDFAAPVAQELVGEVPPMALLVIGDVTCRSRCSSLPVIGVRPRVDVGEPMLTFRSGQSFRFVRAPILSQWHVLPDVSKGTQR